LRAGRGRLRGGHAVADTEYDWAWYGGLVGAYFESPPRVQEAEVKVIDRTHPTPAGLPERWTRADEWCNFRTDPCNEVHVLAALGEGSYSPREGAMGSEHPISWCHGYDGGRSWYTGAGHTPESYRDDLFLEHLLRGIESAAGASEPACGAAGSRRSLPGNATTPNG
jgi:type 1 glutamine amidotransferase